MDSNTLEEQHKMLVQTLQSIPEIDIKTLPVKRRRGADYVQARFDLIRDRIAYLDALALGLRPVDPLDRIDWQGHTLERRNLELRGNLAWAKLQVINIGFDLIRDRAIAEGHNFPFDSPRALFREIMRQQRDFELQPILTDEPGAGLNQTGMRAVGAKQSALYRGRLESTQEEKEFLEQSRSLLWSGFWLYSIWEHRFRGKEMRDRWQRFMTAHKELVAFLSKTKSKGSLVWNQGTPINARTGRPVDWSSTPIKLPDVTESLHGLDFFHSQRRRDI